MMKRIAFLLCALITLTCLSSCYYQQERTDAWDVDSSATDSLYFMAQHHYTVGYNFQVKQDSLMLCTEIPSRAQQLAIMPDSISVYDNDEIVVAEIEMVPEDSLDSVWIKVAHDQATQGWIRESELLPAVSPNDPISQAIYTFSGNHVWGTFLLLGIVFVTFVIQFLWAQSHPHPKGRRYYLPHLRMSGVYSVYPLLLCLTLSGSAVFYASMQLFVPQTWTEFYFHPTLNPFAVPALLGAFLFSVWLMLLFLLATIDDAFRQLTRGEAVLYMLTMATLLAVLYLFFSLSTLIYIGYPLYGAFVFYMVRHYLRHNNPRYRCGQCGKPLHDKGICPHCGAVNE